MIVPPVDHLPRSRAPRSCRPGMVLVDQPTEDLPPRDRLGPRRPRAWDRAVDIVRTTKIQPGAVDASCDGGHTRARRVKGALDPGPRRDRAPPAARLRSVARREGWPAGSGRG